MDVLVTGGSGTFGSKLVPLLLEHGHRVRALTRREHAPLPPGVEVVRGDLRTGVGGARAAAGADARDPGLVAGLAFAVSGAAGRFWSPAGNDPIPLDGLQAFVAYAEPGMATTAFSIEVVGRREHTAVVTESRIVGSDDDARRAFGRYWLLIRRPIGLIRRSWSAAIDRRAAA